MTPQKIDCRKLYFDLLLNCSKILLKSSFEHYKLYHYKHDDLEKVNS